MTKQYLNELESANYFGGYNGETQHEISKYRTMWVDSMALLGFTEETNILDGDGYESSEFTAACDKALEIVSNCGVVFSGNAMVWADDCFDAIEATSQAAEAFDASPEGELYLKITGCTMSANIGAQTL